MEYQEFLEKVKNETGQYLGEEFTVAIHQVLKNNAVSLYGLVITEKEQNISPTIYMEPFFRQLMEGADFEDIFKEILQVYEESRLKENMDVSFFTDYSQVRELLFLKLINYAANTELLKLVPHTRFLDLAIVPYCFVKNIAVGEASILVYHSHMEMWKIEERELMLEAKKNTREIMGSEIMALKELVEEAGCCEELPAGKEGEETEMYVLSNRYKLNGAICMTYPDVLDAFSEKTGKNLYVLPSSIHEVILIPASGMYELDRLSEMVHEVNMTQVEQEELLSDHAYYYEKNIGFDKSFMNACARN
ncbi:MAG TPA: DUF5688 family protein [Lachnospiraceae bacterium]|nr:DUF5688 family protein [Lachnospiraceae bacterium]